MASCSPCSRCRPGCGLLQYLPAQAAMLALAAQLLAVAACPARRELRQARWPGAAAADAGRR
jgi:hypothetical protein